MSSAVPITAVDHPGNIMFIKFRPVVRTIFIFINPTTWRGPVAETVIYARISILNPRTAFLAIFFGSREAKPLFQKHTIRYCVAAASSLIFALHSVTPMSTIFLCIARDRCEPRTAIYEVSTNRA